MSVRIFLLSTIATILLSVSAAHAAAGSPVAHSHNGRSHSHPLPDAGKNHTHGGKKKNVRSDAGNGWSNFAEVKSSTEAQSSYVDFKNGSYSESKNKSGDVIGTLIIKTRYIKSTRVSLEKVYVTKKDCLKGYGELVVLDLGGKFLYDVNFAEGAGTVSADIASITCQFFKKDDLKSL